MHLNVGANPPWLPQIPRGCPNIPWLPKYPVVAPNTPWLPQIPRGCLKYRGRHGGATPTTSTFCLDLLRVIWKDVGTGALPLQPLH